MTERKPDVITGGPVAFDRLAGVQTHKPTAFWLLNGDEDAPEGTAETVINDERVAFRPCKEREDEGSEYLQ